MSREGEIGIRSTEYVSSNYGRVMSGAAHATAEQGSDSRSFTNFISTIEARLNIVARTTSAANTK